MPSTLTDNVTSTAYWCGTPNVTGIITLAHKDAKHEKASRIVPPGRYRGQPLADAVQLQFPGSRSIPQDVQDVQKV